MSSRTIRLFLFVLVGLLLGNLLLTLLKPADETISRKLRDVSHRLDSVSYHLIQANHRIDSILYLNQQARIRLEKLNHEVDSLNYGFVKTQQSSTLKINKLKKDLKVEQDKLLALKHELNKL